MELERKPFQGVMNIIRFNWHFYLIAGLVITAVFIFINHIPEQIKPYIFGVVIITSLSIFASLCFSYYIYDCSNLYQFNWFKTKHNSKILNVHAGFDETSAIIKRKFSNSSLINCDFYDPKNHTEVSIERARKAYPQPENTIQVSTKKLPFEDEIFDDVLLTLSAHEIRKTEERIQFFKELYRISKPSGKIFVTEHLRDFPNFLAYAIGFLHFHSKSTWLHTFTQSNLVVKSEIKTTAFITTFILEKNENSI